jgi:hypothetical protein
MLNHVITDHANIVLQIASIFVSQLSSPLPIFFKEFLCKVTCSVAYTNPFFKNYVGINFILPSSLPSHFQLLVSGSGKCSK